MLKNKKIMLAVALPVLLLAGYTMTKPKPAAPKMKIQGEIYPMPQSFLLNLRDGRYAKVTVALELAPGQSSGAAAGASTSSGGENGPGTLPEEAAVREIITDTITNQSGESLISSAGRLKVRHQILAAIKKRTDVKVEQVLFPDLTVQ